MKKAWLAMPLFLAALAAGAAGRPVDYGNSEIAFGVKQMGVPVTGVFKRFKAAITLDPAKPEAGSAQIEVDIASLSTGNDEADDTARDTPWLDAQHFPKASFKSTAIKALGGDRYEVTGPLTIKGKTRDVTAPFRLAGGSVAAGEFTLHRTDFGIGGGEWNEGDVVANEVTVRFRITLGAPR